jgi:1-acyl-sn-glycerol-3-phosphate acyltransferase
MATLFWNIWCKLKGWKVNGKFPYDQKKILILVAPHTSWKDIMVGLAARSKLKIYKAKFLGKKELFDGPFGWFFKWLGGVPVDRFSKQGAVEQVAEMFNKNAEFIIALSPEGTRKKVEKLRTGFYHIAKQANVPIQMVGFDFSKKEIILGELFYTTDDEAADIRHIINFYAPIKGVKPDQGLAHLKESS